MSDLYRGPSIDASYQVSVHLAKRFRRRFLKNRPIRNKNCLWWPYLLIDRDKMSNLLERTFHICFLLSFNSFGREVLEEKVKMRKVNGQRTPSDGKSSHCLWQGELKSCEFEFRSWRGVLDTTLCDRVCQWLAAGRWFSPSTVSSINITDRHDITEILLKVGTPQP